jgi:hypothetical protein
MVTLARSFILTSPFKVELVYASFQAEGRQPDWGREKVAGTVIMFLFMPLATTRILQVRNPTRLVTIGS